MGDDIKKEFKKFARETETRLAESLLRWRYQKEGKEVPDEENLRRASNEVSDRANRILSNRLGRVWGEMKQAYKRKGRRGGDEG